jgi:Protein of unknown function (DUF3987)
MNAREAVIQEVPISRVVPTVRQIVVASFVYTDEDRKRVWLVKRIEPGDDGAAKKFNPHRFLGIGAHDAAPNGFAKKPKLDGHIMPLYRLPTLLLEAQNNGTAYLVEGEGKAKKLRAAFQRAGIIVAVTTPAFGAQNHRHFDPHVVRFAGLAEVIVLADSSDKAGRPAAKRRSQLIADTHPLINVKVVDLFPDRDDDSDVADWLKDHDVCELRALVDAAPRVIGRAITEIGHTLEHKRSSAAQLWPEFKELSEVINPAPGMIGKLVPEPLRAWCVDTTERMNVNLEMVVVPAIVVAGSLLGRSIGIRPKRHDDEWLVVPNLWGGIVAPPATMKSPAIAAVVRHLRDIEARYRDEHENAMNIHEMMKADLNAEIEELHGEDRREKRRELDELTRKPPVCRRISTSDTTPEKLGDLLQNNPRGLLLIRDELMGWLASFDRAGHEGERQLYLEAWNGNGGYAVDRIGRGSIYIPALCVSVLGGIQPSKLAAYVREAHGDDPGNNGADGLLQRFQLLVWPDEQPNFVNVDRRSDEEARARAFAAFDRLEQFDATQIGAMRDEYDKIPFLHFDDEAQLIFDVWREQLERRLPSKEIRSVPAFEAHLTKYRSLIPSLALIFHLLEEDAYGPVTVKAIGLAIEWCDYLELHARKVYSVAERSPGRILAGHIEDGKLIDGMPLREIAKKGWGGLKNVDLIKAAVAEIEPLGWCRIEEHKPPGRGRSSTVIRLHPHFFAAGDGCE